MRCTDAVVLIPACADGEADAWQAHALKRHLVSCPHCAAIHAELLALRARIRAEAPRFATPAALRARVLATARTNPPAIRAAPRSVADRCRRHVADLLGMLARPPAHASSNPSGARWRWLTTGAIAGCAATVLAWSIGTTVLDWRTREDLAVEAVTMHVRATLGNQLIQVASSDQHTVKPWLSARLDYSPPVRDMAADGFALMGGRVDYLDRRAVATLVYRFRKHNIDVFVQPESARAMPVMRRSMRGFNVESAAGSGMNWLAVSDVNPDVLRAFVDRLAREAGLP